MRQSATTLLEMLNSVPCIGLSGENEPFMSRLVSLDSITRNLNHKRGAWFNDVDFEKLLLAERNWISSLNWKKTKIVSGFKEIRIDSIPFFKQLFPNAYHIINYRRNHTLQLQSSFHRRSSDTTLYNKEAAMRKYLKNQTVFEIALEDFTVEKFNEILSWIGITKYLFTGLLHSNKKGYNSDQSSVCSLQCSCWCRGSDCVWKKENCVFQTPGGSYVQTSPLRCETGRGSKAPRRKLPKNSSLSTF